MKTINGQTTILAVFGDPVDHSLSPAMHNAAFKAMGLDCVYVPFRVLPEDIILAVRGIRALNIKGVNVTIPHKQAVVPELDEIVGDAALSGSVNTIINNHGKLIGTSTDGSGLIRSLEAEAGFKVAGKNVLMLGSGGAATAIVFSLIGAGIRSLTVVNRDVTKAVSLREKTRVRSKFEFKVVGLAQLEALDWSEFDIVINTTSVGLHDQATLIPAHLLYPGLVVYDVVYRPGGTTLANQAKAAGCTVLTGLSLLLYQGVDSFRLWFGVEPPLEVMGNALVTAIGSKS